MTDLQHIEDNAIRKFTGNLNVKDFNDDTIRDYLDVRVDVDKYVKRLFECTIGASTILEWVQDDFSTILESYLRSKHAHHMFDLASSQDLDNSNSYFDFCLDICQEALDYWLDHGYQDRAWEHFRYYAEEV